ncbi:MAG: TatD family deoxyribonuclease [Ruminococcaceae bacterium]|nr:TatD family deoxyribonuclease [Oscillospiraceae bacterium]
MYPLPSYPAAKGSIIDSHAHYNDRRFDGCREALLENLSRLGVKKVINCGCDFQLIDEVLALSNKYDFCFSAVGFHPENIPDGDIDFARLDKIIKENKKIIALGETGLDYNWRSDNKERQKDAFKAQLVLAKENSLPVIVHDRDAHADTLEILKEHRPTGVVHCFSGSVEMAQEALKLGMYIGIGGVLTFKNGRVLKEVAKEIPLERILLETDAPYLSPEPFRGKLNHSGLIIYVAEKLAEIKNVSVETVLSITSKNTEELFGI